MILFSGGFYRIITGLILDNNHALGLLIVSNDDWSKNLFLIHPQDNETISKVPPSFEIR